MWASDDLTVMLRMATTTQLVVNKDLREWEWGLRKLLECENKIDDFVLLNKKLKKNL